MSQQKLSANDEANQRIEKLTHEIAYIDRLIEAKTKRAKQLHADGNQSGALTEARLIGLEEKKKRLKEDALKQLTESQYQYTRVAEFVENQRIIGRITNEKDSLAQELDIDDIHELTMESRVIDRSVDKILDRVGFSEDDRVENQREDQAILDRIVAPPQQQPQQRVVNNTNTGTMRVAQQQAPTHQRSQPPNKTLNNNSPKTGASKPTTGKSRTSHIQSLLDL